MFSMTIVPSTPSFGYPPTPTCNTSLSNHPQTVILSFHNFQFTPTIKLLNII
ncbi:hypothetical protein HanRHA438_Chr02g0055771 [Helianthus annuus]|nr:hypothetical protein HanRHA438_Chr02g0055771 [Helianthus annuus]